MSPRVALCLAALAVAVAAWPSGPFVKVDIYTSNTLCTAASSTPQSTKYYALDTCVVAGASTSTKLSADAANANSVLTWSYTGTICAGTPVLGINYTVGGCASTGLNFARTSVLSSSVGMWSQTSYSDTTCGNAASGPTFAMQGCNSGASYSVGGKLEICYPSGSGNADCSGDLTCASVSHGDCNEFQSGTASGSILYDWNAASSAAPAVALTAALVAVVAAVTNF